MNCGVGWGEDTQFSSQPGVSIKIVSSDEPSALIGIPPAEAGR